MKITEKTARKYHAKPQKSMLIVRDELLTGFAMKVSKTGRISFCTEARIRGQGGSAKRRTIGKYPAFTVEDAREIAQNNLKLMYLGQDPQEVRKEKIDIRQESDDWTLKKVLEEYLTRRDLKDSTKRYYTQVVSQVYPDWLYKPISNISRRMVEDRFFDQKKSVGGISTRILSALMNYAKAVTLSNGDRLITENPVDILKEKRISRALPRRQTVIDPKELTRILSNIDGELVHGEGRSKISTSSLMAIYVIALTGSRKNEILTLRKKDIHLHGGYFTIRDTKNRSDHVVPITEAIFWIIETAMRSPGHWLFPNVRDPGQPIKNPKVAVERYLRGYTLHDCRRTFATVASELGISLDSIKALMNHKSQDVTQGYIIKRTEQRLPRLHKLFTQVQLEMVSHTPEFRELF